VWPGWAGQGRWAGVFEGALSSSLVVAWPLIIYDSRGEREQTKSDGGGNKANNNKTKPMDK